MTSRQFIWTAIILLLLILSGIGYYVALRSGLLGERFAAGAPQEQGEMAEGEAPGPQAGDAAKDQSRVPPTLDIVRVEPTGETVVAGRAAPGATVRLEKGGEVIGEAVANREGEWVIVPQEPLGAGSSQVGLFSVMEDGTEVPAEESIVIEVGEGGETQPLVVVTRGDAPSEVMQAPEVAQQEQQLTEADAADVTPMEERAVVDGAAPATGEAADAMAPVAQDGAVAPESGASAQGTAGTTTADPSSPAAAADESAAGQAAEPGVAEVQPSTPDTQGAELSPAGTQVAGSGQLASADQSGAAQEPSSVQVQTVESDSQGRIFASGMAQPGSSVQVYLENEPLGLATTDGEGRWEIAAAKPLAPGDYNVRVDQIDASGAVEARSQVVFNQAEPVAAAAASELPATAPDSIQLQKLEIRRGDNLWRISRRLYGRGIRYTVIYDANRNVITNPDLIFPGQVFVIPPDELPQAGRVQNN